MSTRSSGFDGMCRSPDSSGRNDKNVEFFCKNAADLFTVAKSKLFMPFYSLDAPEIYHRRSWTYEISKKFDKSLLVG